MQFLYESEDNDLLNEDFSDSLSSPSTGYFEICGLKLPCFFLILLQSTDLKIINYPIHTIGTPSKVSQSQSH